MSAEEFWHGDTKLCKAYKEAYKTRKYNKDVNAWMSGLYVLEALRTASPLFREWSKGVEHSYPEEPLTTEHFKDSVLSEEEKDKLSMEKNKLVFGVFATAFNAKFEKE